jgi:hypothetical protein
MATHHGRMLAPQSQAVAWGPQGAWLNEPGMGASSAVSKQCKLWGPNSKEQDELGSAKYLAGDTGPGIMLQCQGPRMVPTLSPSLLWSYGGIARQRACRDVKMSFPLLSPKCQAILTSAVNCSMTFKPQFKMRLTREGTTPPGGWGKLPEELSMRGAFQVKPHAL